MTGFMSPNTWEALPIMIQEENLAQRSVLNRNDLLRCCVAMFFCLAFMAQAAATLHIEGTVSFTQYKRNGMAANPVVGRYSLATDYLKWKVKYHDDTSKTESETTFDGTFTYTLFANLPIANLQASEKYIGTNKLFPDGIIFTNGHYYPNADNAIVGASPQPVSLFASGQVAWMGLLACGLVSNAPSRLLPPWPFPPGEELSYRSRVDESNRDRDGWAPIEYITSQQFWDVAKKETASQDDRRYVPKEPFVEGRFQVLSRTNLQNKCIPLEGEFVRYWYPSLQMLPGKTVRTVIRTTTTKYYLSSDTIPLPILSKKTYVTDSRFNTVESSNFPVHYALTGKTWLNENDPRLVRWVGESRTNYHRMQEIVKKQTNKPVSNPRIPFIVFTLLVAAVPLVIVLLRRR